MTGEPALLQSAVPTERGAAGACGHGAPPRTRRRAHTDPAAAAAAAAAVTVRPGAVPAAGGECALLVHFGCDRHHQRPGERAAGDSGRTEPPGTLLVQRRLLQAHGALRG